MNPAPFGERVHGSPIPMGVAVSVHVGAMLYEQFGNPNKNWF